MPLGFLVIRKHPKKPDNCAHLELPPDSYVVTIFSDIKSVYFLRSLEK